jgi:hypothetical protein
MNSSQILDIAEARRQPKTAPDRRLDGDRRETASRAADLRRRGSDQTKSV